MGFGTGLVGVGCPVVDAATSFRIDIAFTADLTTAQSAAVSALIAHDDGVLVAPPCSGKTVMACSLIAERATSTLILVDCKALGTSSSTSVTILPLRPTTIPSRPLAPSSGSG